MCLTVKTDTTQTRRLALRAEPRQRTEREGIVEALVAAFDVEYPIGGGLREVIRPGAFSGAVGEPIAVFYQHGHQHGHAPIGTALAREETSEGLRIEARLFLAESEKARATYAALEAGALREWSVGFRPIKTRESDRGRLIEVLEAELPEVSAVLVGANPSTQTLAVREGSLDLRRRREQEEAAQRVGEVLAGMAMPGTTLDRLYAALEQSRRFRDLFTKALGR